MARGFRSLPLFAQDDDPSLSPTMRAFLQGLAPDDGSVPATPPPGFTGFSAPPTPTGPATPAIDWGAVSGIGQRAADVGAGLADMGSRTADLFGRLRSGEIDPGAFALAAGSHLAGQAVDTVRSAAAAPRDAWTGDLQVFGSDGHPTQEAMDRASGLAGLAMTGSMPFKAPAGALRTFGGRSAATADHAALARAEGMAAQGADRTAIWNETGWFTGTDGKWRFEIPDDAARMRGPGNASALEASGGGTLGGALAHPDLYAAYPKLADTNLIGLDSRGAFNGQYMPAPASARGGTIALSDHLFGDGLRSTVLHEAQHGVQRAEGFARGGSADGAGYRNLAGEVEARNVETRRDFTPEQRRTTPPWETQDVPDAQQAVRSGGGAPQMAAEAPGAASNTLVSRAPPMYDPVPRAARPFEADYPAARWPDGPPVDASGRLTHDIDGRPLDPGARVVGRRLAGGADQALAPAELDAVAAAALGQEPLGVPAQSVPGGGVGAYRRVQAPEGIERTILYNRSLPDGVRNRVVAHELGHGVDEIAGDFVGSRAPMPTAIPQNGIRRELGALYNETNNPALRGGRELTGEDLPRALAQGVNRRNFTPEAAGYPKGQAPVELMAEAVRSYLADPNAMKAGYPKTAARIRQAVADSPTLSPVLRFNALPAMAGAGAAGAALLAQPGEAQAAGSPLDPKGQPVSAGIAPFGSLPALAGFSPEDLAALMQRFGVGQPQAATPDPQTAGSLGQPGPPVAMDEAQTRALEQQSGMVPNGYGGAPQGQSGFGPLFDPAPMGAPQSFAGVSGQIMPQGTPDAGPAAASPLRRFGALPGLSDDSGPVPLPPQRPDDAGLSVVGVPDRGGPTATGALREGPFKDSSLGRTPADLAGIRTNPPAEPRREGARPAPMAPGGSAAPPSPGQPPTIDLQRYPETGRPPGALSYPNAGGPLASPGGDFDPLTGQALTGNVRPVAVPGRDAGPMQKFLDGTGLGRIAGQPAGLNGSDLSSLLMHISAGLLSTRGIGPGVGAGLSSYQNSQAGSLKSRLEQFKLGQEIEGQNATYGHLVRNMGVAPDVARAAVLNPALLNTLLSKANKDPTTFEYGGNKYIGRADQDPSTWQKLGPSAGPQVVEIDGYKYALRDGEKPSEANKLGAVTSKDPVHFDRDPVTGELTAYRTDELFPDKGAAGKAGAAAAPGQAGTDDGAAGGGVSRVLSPGNRSVRVFGQPDPRTGEIVQPPPNSPPGSSGYYDPMGRPVILDRSPETERDKAIGGAVGKDIAGYIEAGKPAREKMAALNILDDAWKAGKDKITTGPTADRVLGLKQFARGALGMQIGDDIAPSELIAKIGTQLATADAKSLTARPTQFDFATYLRNNPGLALTPEGNAALIAIKKQQAQHEIDLASLARDRKNWDNWDEVTAAYDKAHPIISPLTKRPLGADEVNFPDPSAQVAARVPSLEVGGTHTINGAMIRRVR